MYTYTAIASLRKDDPFRGFFHHSLLINAVTDERYVNDLVIWQSAESIVLAYILCDGFHNYGGYSILVL